MSPCAAPSRRDVVVAAAAAACAAFSLSGCGTAHRHPGRLTYLLRGEPYTLDPGRSAGGAEGWILSALLARLSHFGPF